MSCYYIPIKQIGNVLDRNNENSRAICKKHTQKTSEIVGKVNRDLVEEKEIGIMSEKITRENRKFKFETLQLHVGQEQPDPVTDARAVPIYQTSSYVFRQQRSCSQQDLVWQMLVTFNGRLTNPTEDVFEKRIAALEGGVAALAVASGAAAISYTIENLAQNGDHIVAAKNIYGGSFNLLEHTLPQYGITTTFVDIFNRGRS